VLTVSHPHIKLTKRTSKLIWEAIRSQRGNLLILSVNELYNVFSIAEKKSVEPLETAMLRRLTSKRERT
jgi:hypothetical protein